MMNIYLQPLSAEDAEPILKMEQRNREFFSQFAPDRDDQYYTLEGQISRMKKFEENREKDSGYSFGIYLHQSKKLIGQIGFFKVERGPAQKAMIGYSLDQDHNGKGYMTEAVQLIVDFGFNELNLHRIEAEVMPHNKGSIRILEKSGFHKEGISKKNVMINGNWEDHQVLAIINESYRAK
ncbi:GNAT family protein [Metabacillus sp. FJAT-52054]|uniref:GNAT family protein n=1 Tax=Metabacillus sediminis TaxID=3117746 RepID=A0ABZ2NI00_9BACI